MTFRWRSLQRRPQINIEIARCDIAAWKLFSPFHYLTNELHRAANCFVLFANGEPASFGGVIHRPHPQVRDIKGLSRLVTLPDFQGLGLAMVLVDRLGECYKDLGLRFRTYPAHPSLVRSFDHSDKWTMKKKPGVFSPLAGKSSTLGRAQLSQTRTIRLKKWKRGRCVPVRCSSMSAPRSKTLKRQER